MSSNEKSGVGARLQSIMDNHGLTQADVSDRANVSRRTVSRHLDREHPPKHAQAKNSLDKIAEALSLDRTWLLTGKGFPHPEAEKKSSLEVEGSEETNSVTSHLQGSPRFTLTVYHQVEAGAADNGHINYAADLQEADTAEYPRELFHDLLGFWPPAEMQAVYARGVSMEPGVRDERLVLYKPVNDVVSGTRYVVHIYDPMTGDWYTRVKRLHRLTGGGLRIISDNPRVADETLILNENEKLVNEETGRPVNLRVIGRVLWPTAETDEERVQTITQTLQQLASSGQLDLS